MKSQALKGTHLKEELHTTVSAKRFRACQIRKFLKYADDKVHAHPKQIITTEILTVDKRTSAYIQL